jgi:hypothetical protein
VRATGKQDLGVWRNSSVVIEKGAVVRDCRRMERSTVI